MMLVIGASGSYCQRRDRARAGGWTEGVHRAKRPQKKRKVDGRRLERGPFAPSSLNSGAGLAGQPLARNKTAIFLTLNAAHTRSHSLATFWPPRYKNRRKPIPALICPNGGSTVHLRRRYSSRCPGSSMIRFSSRLAR